MGFRQKKVDNAEQNEWAQWLEQHADLINASGLPPLVLSHQDHWQQFIEHGCLLRSGEEAGQFNVDWLTLRQKAVTLRLIRSRSSLHPTPVETELIFEMIRAVEEFASE